MCIYACSSVLCVQQCTCVGDGDYVECRRVKTVAVVAGMRCERRFKIWTDQLIKAGIHGDDNHLIL